MTRLAAIDVGSNAMRLRIVQLTADGRPIELASMRAPVRLGAEVFATRKISRRTLERAAVSFLEFRERMDEAGIDDYRAVATSATREAVNSSALVRAAAEAHIELEVIPFEQSKVLQPMSR